MKLHLLQTESSLGRRVIFLLERDVLHKKKLQSRWCSAASRDSFTHTAWRFPNTPWRSKGWSLGILQNLRANSSKLFLAKIIHHSFRYASRCQALQRRKVPASLSIGLLYPLLCTMQRFEPLGIHLFGSFPLSLSNNRWSSYTFYDNCCFTNWVIRINGKCFH